MAVITISREIGSGGSFIALKLAEALEYTCADKEILHEIAKRMGKPHEELRDFDQETYNRIGVFFQEALTSIARGGRVFHPFGIGPLDWDGIELFAPFPQSDFREDEYRTVLQQVMRELAARDNSIILGRGGARILQNHPTALHLRIVADEATRIARLIDQQKIDESKAREVIAQSDEAARTFIADFFGADWADPHLYHLTLNTSRIEIDRCVALIIQQVQVQQTRATAIT